MLAWNAPYGTSRCRDQRHSREIVDLVGAESRVQRTMSSFRRVGLLEGDVLGDLFQVRSVFILFQEPGDPVTLFHQQFGEVGTVLTGDSCYDGAFHSGPPRLQGESNLRSVTIHRHGAYLGQAIYGFDGSFCRSKGFSHEAAARPAIALRGSGMTPIFVCVVVLTWNRRADTLECLRSLARVTEPEIRVILVDNGSSDGTVDAVREEFPGSS